MCRLPLPEKAGEVSSRAPGQAKMAKLIRACVQGWPLAAVWALGWQGFVLSGRRAGVPTLLVQTLVFAKHPLLPESAVRFT